MQTDLDPPTTAAGDDDADTSACDLIKALEASRDFRRDSLLGGIFHPGYISFRELSPIDSMHIVIRGNRVSAHVDDVSPLILRPDGTARYAWGRVIAHNVAVLFTDIARRIRGLHGLQRCNLRCEVVKDA